MHWRRLEAALQALSADRLFDYACQQLRDRQIKLPAEGELRRVVNTALSEFFQDMNRAHFRGNSTRRSQPYKALARACAFLEIDPKLGEKIERADTMVLSDALNYVDFRKVLSGFVTYLKPGGRLIILNLPHRGNQLLFSDQGPKDNRPPYSFLEEHCFEIEHKDFPNGRGMRKTNFCWWRGTETIIRGPHSSGRDAHLDRAIIAQINYVQRPDDR